MLVAIDAFPDSMIFKFENVTGEDAPKIVFDLLFPRGPEGAKHTKVFINGSNFEEVEKVVAATQKAMKSAPWGNSIIVDPRGGYSTAAAAVAKTFGASMEKKLGSLEGKKVTVLAGTGPVGQTAARIYAAEKADVTITSRSTRKGTSQSQTKSTLNAAQNASKSSKYPSQSRQQQPLKTQKSSSQQAQEASSCLAQQTLAAAPKCKIVADINAIKPLGVEGLGPNDDKEMKPGVWGIGALAIGKLKIKTETEMIKRATAEPSGLFDYAIAYTIAKDQILKKLAKAAAK